MRKSTTPPVNMDDDPKGPLAHISRSRRMTGGDLTAIVRSGDGESRVDFSAPDMWQFPSVTH